VVVVVVVVVVIVVVVVVVVFVVVVFLTAGIVAILRYSNNSCITNFLLSFLQTGNS